MESSIMLVIGTPVERRHCTVSLGATIREILKDHVSDKLYQDTFNGCLNSMIWEINCHVIGLNEYDEPLESFLDSRAREYGKAWLVGSIKSDISLDYYLLH